MALPAWLGDILGSAFVGPLVNGAVQAHKNSLDAGNTKQSIAAQLASRELAVQQREIEVQGELRKAQVGVWYEPEKIFSYILAGYFFKLILWDKVIGSFAGYTPNIFQTDPIQGAALEWAGMIMIFLFGMKTVRTVSSMFVKGK